MKRWPFVVALALMGGTWMLLASRSQAEPEIARRPFSELPIRLGEWSGRDRELDKEVLELLKLTDYVMRVYVPGSSQQTARNAFEGQTRQAAAPVALYVGYYASQRSGATYHSPKNCLPGGGWEPLTSGTASIDTPNGPVLLVPNTGDSLQAFAIRKR